MQIEIKREQHIDTEKIEWHIDTEKIEWHIDTEKIERETEQRGENIHKT